MFYSTARVLAVLELLQTHGRMRGEQLAERLEVDVRTIRRYVMILRDQNYPVEMLRGRYGGYQLRPDFKKPLTLTAQEAVVIACSLLSTRSQQRALANGDEQVLAKLTRVLPAQTRALVQNLERAVTFAAPNTTNNEPFVLAHLAVLVHAVHTHQQVNLHYRDGNGAETERVVDPYQVVNRYGRWYLVGYCHLRTSQRVFRLDRICAVTLLTATFDPPPIDALAVVEQAIAQTLWQWEYTVQLDLSLTEARQRIPTTIADLAEQEQGVLMHGYIEDLAWLAHLLAGLRCRLIVLNPPELRTHLLALADHIRAIASQYAF